MYPGWTTLDSGSPHHFVSHSGLVITEVAGQGMGTWELAVNFG